MHQGKQRLVDKSACSKSAPCEAKETSAQLVLPGSIPKSSGMLRSFSAMRPCCALHIAFRYVWLGAVCRGIAIPFFREQGVVETKDRAWRCAERGWRTKPLETRMGSCVDIMLWLWKNDRGEIAGVRLELQIPAANVGSIGSAVVT